MYEQQKAYEVTLAVEDGDTTRQVVIESDQEVGSVLQLLGKGSPDGAEAPSLSASSNRSGQSAHHGEYGLFDKQQMVRPYSTYMKVSSIPANAQLVVKRRYVLRPVISARGRVVRFGEHIQHSAQCTDLTIAESS